MLSLFIIHIFRRERIAHCALDIAPALKIYRQAGTLSFSCLNYAIFVLLGVLSKSHIFIYISQIFIL